MITISSTIMQGESDKIMAAAFSMILPTLQKAVGLLAPSDAQLKEKVLHQCDRIITPTLRIAVFGPFNYGKSTLLNALLGEKTLPIDLVPTTGAAITITHGPELVSHITLTNGNILKETGTDLLQPYATLNEQRQRHQDVAAVTVECPHPFLQLGVELIDLPGTDDHDVQNELVYGHLLEANVVIHLLDGRKLMTLTEREHLQHWLLDRGITTTVFVVNFLNLMAAEERQQVMERLRLLAQDFRATLPAGVSNLYAVDALPALRARLKGDRVAAAQTGLLTFESALHTLAQGQRSQLTKHRITQLFPLVSQVEKALQQQLHSLETETLSQTDSRRIAIKKRAQQLIQTGFQQSVNDLQNWLQLPNLLEKYHHSLTLALQQGAAPQWREENLQAAWKRKKRAVTEWVYQACDIFNQPRPVDPWIDWRVNWPHNTSAIPSTLTGETNPSPRIARRYLARFSNTALTTLDTYIITAKPILNQSVSTTAQQQQVGKRTLLQNTLAELQQLQDELNAF